MNFLFYHKKLVAVLCTIIFVITSGCKPSKPTEQQKLTRPVSTSFTNGDFENPNEQSWQFVAKSSEKISGEITKGGGRNGTRGVILRLNPQQRIGEFSQKLFLPPLTKISVSAWITTAGQNVRGFIHIECLNLSNTAESNYGELASTNSQTITGNSDWTKVEATISIPDKTEFVQVWGCAEGTNGIVRFDDFSFASTNKIQMR